MNTVQILHAISRRPIQREQRPSLANLQIVSELVMIVLSKAVHIAPRQHEGSLDELVAVGELGQHLQHLGPLMLDAELELVAGGESHLVDGLVGGGGQRRHVQLHGHLVPAGGGVTELAGRRRGSVDRAARGGVSHQYMFSR